MTGSRPTPDTSSDNSSSNHHHHYHHAGPSPPQHSFLSPQLSSSPPPPHSTHTTTLLVPNNNSLSPSTSPVPPPTASSSGSHQRRPASSSFSSNRRYRDDPSSDSVRKEHSQSISSNPLTVASSSKTNSSRAERPEPQHTVRTLPPWVQSADEEESADPTSLLLPRTPVSARPPSRNFMPTPKNTVPGRKFDHAREGAPVTQVSSTSNQASKWQQFTKASNLDHVRPPSSRGQIVDDAWMEANMPDLEEPWQPMDQEEKEQEEGFWLFNKQKRARFHRILMNHPMVPLGVRMIVLAFSVLALSLAGAIFHKSDNQSCENNSSTWMAILVDVVAILYTIYITYDEYTSKPLGLRSHNAKMRLIFLDLAFIVFDSANLSLAFQALTDEQWACRDASEENKVPNNCPYSKDICVRQKALTATLLAALVAWLGTFTISTLRLLERVAR